MAVLGGGRVCCTVRGSLARRYHLDGVVVTVDAELGLARLTRHPEAQRQVAVAGRLVVTKADRANAETIAALTSG